MDKALETMINNMPEKTGKSLEEWKLILKKETFSKHSEGVSFLKNEYNVTHGFANTIVSLSKEESTDLLQLVNSHFFVIRYLGDLDHFIKHALCIKAYVR